MLTVLVNCHREGHLVHPALRSAVLAVDEAQRRGVPCRILVIVDRGDGFTQAEIARFGDRLHAVHEVDYGNLSHARTAGIERIETKYLATLDGDDLLDRDWLWKGVQFLERLGDDNAVAHTELRLSFGSERHGRLQIGTDSHLFHPLNLIASWHYAADLIAPTAVYRRLPFAPNDYDHGFGGEDWWWTCESIVAGVRHVIVPGTVSYYRRQPNHVSLGSLPGITFRPTRLLERRRAEALARECPSAALRFADRLPEITGPAGHWASAPSWVEESVRRACGLEPELYDLHAHLVALPFWTPAVFPAVGHLYLKLMAGFGEGRERVVFFCDRLTPRELGAIDGFLAAQRPRRGPPLDVLIVTLAPGGGAAAPEAGGDPGSDPPWLGLRAVDLGGTPAFQHLWERLQLDLLIRFLLQARPALAVNLDSPLCDRLIGHYGRSVAAEGIATVRLCRDRVPGGSRQDLVDHWRALGRAEGRYSKALCPSSATAAWLGTHFGGTGCRFLPCDCPEDAGADRAIGSTLLDILGGRLPEVPGPGGAGTFTAAADALPDVSCVVTVRAEGHHLNQSLGVLRAMCDRARDAGLAVEVVVVADRPGRRTRNVLAALPGIWPAARIVETDLGDEGGARNAGIAAARGRHVAVLKGADLVSPDWLAEAVRRLEQLGPDAIVHPQAVVTFVPGLGIRYQLEMVDDVAGLAALAFHETWTAQALARRELFQRHPYHSFPPGSGYGHTVWHWNCETVAAGCRHFVVPESAVYRRPEGEDGERAAALGSPAPVTLPPSRFFTDHPWLSAGRGTRSAAFPDDWAEVAYLGDYPDVAGAVAEGVLASSYAHYCLYGRREGRVPAWRASNGAGPLRLAVSRSWRLLTGTATFGIRRLGELARRDPAAAPTPPGWRDDRYLQCHADVAAAVADGQFPSGYAHYCLHGRGEGRSPCWENGGGRAAHGGIPGPLPQWMDEEMRELAAMEPALDPACAGVVVPPPRATRAAHVYRSCRPVVAEVRPTHLLVTTSLRPGGAELSLMHHVEAIQATPENRVLVLTTQAGDERWSHRLPPGCACLPLGALAAGCPREEQVEILTRLLVNAGARCLHLFNADLGWEVLLRHAPALEAQLRIFVSIFSVPPVEVGTSAGYALHVPRLRRHLSGIFTDNHRAAATLAEVCGVPPERITVVGHPVEVRHRFAGPAPGSTLVLWAGRIDADKRPELLAEIAGRLPGLVFHVHGASVLDGGGCLERLRAIPNVVYRGGFTGFDSIPAAPYLCYLHTTRWEGMPNTLLEAMQAGLLAVAPDVGGIAEVVSDDTGLLVREPGRPEAYVEAIEGVLRDPAEGRRRAARGQRFVEESYTRERFLAAVRAAERYA